MAEDRTNSSKESRHLPAAFHWLNATQFLGALNDNLSKQFVIFFLIGLSGVAAANRISAIAAALFAVPFLLFNNVSGALADRHSKRHIVVATKWLELVVMSVGLTGFIFRMPALLYVMMFMMSLQSALFGPAKYGIVPELVPRERLSSANGYLTMFTYVAIILGTALAPWIGETLGGRYAWAHLACILVAAAGVGTSLPIAVTPPAGSTRRGTFRVVSDVVRTLRTLRGNRHLLMAVLASAYFSLIGAYLQVNLIPYGVHHLGLTQEKSGYLFFLAGIGIAVGGWLAGRLSGRNIEFGIVPLGSLVLTGSVVALALVPPAEGTWRGAIIAAAGGPAALTVRSFISALRDVLALVFLVGVGAGLFLVPVDAFIQDRAPAARRGEILAASSWLGWLGVLISAILVGLNPVVGLKPAHGFLILAVLTLALTIVALRVLPDFLLRFLALLLTRTFYRIRTLGSSHVPLDGPGLIIANHVTYLDALLLVATQQRRLRFLMDREMHARVPALHPLLRLMGVIPISHRDAPRQLIEAFRQARTALEEGYLVVIFAEGALTRTGTIRAFREGFERVLKGLDCPIIPVHIGGAWGSIWSYYHGRLVRQWPVSGRYPVTVMFGAPLPSNTPAPAVREAVLELSAAYFENRKSVRRPLGVEFVLAARRRGARPALFDAAGAAISYHAALVRTLIASDRVGRATPGESRIGLLAPPSAEDTLVVLALSLCGRRVVPLDPGTPPAFLSAAIRFAGVRTVLIPRDLRGALEGADLGGAKLMEIESLLRPAGPGARFAAAFKGRFAPAGWIGGPRTGFDPDEEAALLVRPGPAGTPVAVAVSHHNFMSVVESLRIVFEVAPDDVLCAVTPFAHPAGLSAALWFPLLSGVALQYPEPGVPALPRRASLLLAPVAWLETLSVAAVDAPPAARGRLRLAVALSPRLDPAGADAIERALGVRPMVGYGLPETSGVAAISLPNVEVGGLQQARSRAGASGIALPGVAVRVVRPGTRDAVTPGEPGALLIKGPNVARRLGATAPDDGWQDTGDRAVLDEEGFIHLVS